MKRVRFSISSSMPIIQQNLARLAGQGVTEVTVTFQDNQANRMSLSSLVSQEQHEKLKAEFPEGL